MVRSTSPFLFTIFENTFVLNQNDSEIPPLIEPDKNITIMAIEKYQYKPVHY